MLTLLFIVVLASGIAPTASLRHASRNARSVTTVLHSVQPRRTTKGMPSTPGWKDGVFDKLTDWAVSEEANRPIICEYEPDALWLWTRWRGTVLSITVRPILFTMGLGLAVDYFTNTLSASSWPLLSVPPANDPFIEQLQGLNSLWEYQLNLCTFILTFFTSAAYSHWKSVYFTTRAIQGRINDLCLLITVGAQRGAPALTGDDKVTGYSEEATKLVELLTRLIRLSHTFFWAATPTLSDGIGHIDVGEEDGRHNLREKDEVGPLLLSPEGLHGLWTAGELTTEEMAALQGSGLPPSQYTYILLEWVGLYAMSGLKDGTLCADNGFEENLLRQLTSLRAEYFSIGDYTAGRMPLAYVQLVQVLVDSLVYLSPFALFSELGSLSIPLAGLLTFFYKGLLELSKSFLDPFGVEGHPGQNIRVDVLVSELNFGAGSRWVRAGEVLPPAPTKQE